MINKQKKKRPGHSLDEVALRELGTKLDKEQQTADWGGDLTPGMLEYAAGDSRVLLPLAESLERKLHEAGLEKAVEIEHRALPAMARMANAGVPFDVEGWTRRLAHVEEEKAEISERLLELAPEHPEGKTWNWNSSQQVLKVFGLLGLTISDTKEESLVRCEHPLAHALLEYRGLSKLISTYGSSLLERVEGRRIYGSWFQMGAETGRMTCSKPNLQNLPPEVRRYVRAPEGKVLVKADYSQIELRIAAKITGDERMLAAYESGEDLHTLTAMNITGKTEISAEDRKLAKAVNFGLLYGQGARGLKNYAWASYSIEMGPEEAATYRRRFFETYPGLRDWQERERRNWSRGNKETRTLSGRRRNGISSDMERLNSPVQGTGADGLKLALALLHERRRECPGAVPILAVHDELVLECEEERADEVSNWLRDQMREGMEQILNNSESTEELRVPIEVEVYVGKCWERH